MSLGTLLGYLIGRRKAILEIAATPRATWLGLVFVLSAGFARQYDGADLLAQPWRLLTPLAASLILSSSLYCLVTLASCRRREGPWPFLATYSIFLRLFWMTAPLAWIYAIPVERFLDTYGATRANLWMLGIVSLWRILLMTRVVSVLFGARAATATAPVLLFAGTVATIAAIVAPVPVLDLMSGIRLSPSEGLIQHTAFQIRFFGVVSWPIWFLAMLVVVSGKAPKWKIQVEPNSTEGRISTRLWLLAVCSILLWAVVLPFTQPQQHLRHEVESKLRGADIAAGLALMSRHTRSDFPPHWAPPPRIAYAESTPPLLQTVELACKEDTAPWVRAMFFDKLSVQEGPRAWRWNATLEDRSLDRYLTVLEAAPEGLDVVRVWAESLEWSARDCSPEQRERIAALLTAVGHEFDFSELLEEEAEENTVGEDGTGG